MPVDLFEKHSASPMQQPRDLLAGNLPAPEPHTLMGQVINAASDIDIGGANAMRGLVNLPHNVVNYFSPEAASKIPPFAPNFDYEKAYGKNSANTNFIDELIQGAAGYAPFGAVGGAVAATEATPIATKLFSQYAAGNLYGATQDQQNPFAGAAAGGATNLALGGAAEAVSPVIGSAKNALSKYAAQGLSKSLNKIMNGAKSATNRQAFEAAKNNFDTYGQQERQAWDSLSNAANEADASGVPFENEGYINALNEQLSKLKSQSERQTGYERANKDSIDLLKGYQKDTHNTFSAAIEHNKALNQDYQNEITPGKSLPFNTVNFAKSNIKNAIQDNIDNQHLLGPLGDAWKEANRITQEKNQLFNNVVGNTGREQISKFSSFLKNYNQNVDPTNFVSDYLPTGKAEGVEKMAQFSQMLGNDQQAKNVLKLNYFDNAIEQDAINPSKFINKYNHLSTEQQRYLFSSEENKTIQALSKIMDAHPDALTKHSGFLWHTAPAALGALFGHWAGIGAAEGGVGAYLGSRALSAATKKAFEKPEISNYFVDHLMQPKGESSPNALRQALAASLSTFIRPLLTQKITDILPGAR